MDSKKKITVSWSGGKDCTFALYEILQDNRFEIVNIHTVIGRSTRRVGLHGVREELIERQAKEIGFPLVKSYLLEGESHIEYERLVTGLYRDFKRQGITHILFGDIFIEDLKTYREGLLKESEVIPVFPLWKKPTLRLAENFCRAGFKAVLCSANEVCHESDLLGKIMDEKFLQTLPEGIDPCGENGEFHTFVFDGPIFRSSIPYTLGETVEKQYHYSIRKAGSIEKKSTTFYFQDILP